MIQHHPGDEWLLALAAGRVGAGETVVLDVHLESCAACRSRLQVLKALGGALLDESAPELLAPEALARTLTRIDAPAPAAAPATAWPRPALPGLTWPHAMRNARVSRWHRMGPGVRWSRVRLASDPAAALFLLRIASGRSLPRHGHHGIELTQVLCGCFDDGRAVFGPGDFDAVDGSVRHQPVVTAGGECICLASVDGRLLFEGRVASLVARWVGM